MSVETGFPLNALAVALDTDFAVESTVYVGTVGDVSVMTWGNGGPLIFTVPAGGVVPVKCKRVNAAGTTASGLRILW